jgi:hypothetical protein
MLSVLGLQRGSGDYAFGVRKKEFHQQASASESVYNTCRGASVLKLF